MKKYLLIFLSIIIFIPNVNASVNTKNREEIENYGVNKHWTITQKNKKNVIETPLVDASEKVYDFSDKLSDEEKETIKEKLTEFINHTNMDAVFVTVNLPYAYDEKNEEYAADFYDYNDFGIDKEKYSGILLLRNTYEEDPYYNIYTFGNAQLYFSYNRCENMLDIIYDNFHNENYVDGINDFVNIFTNYYDSGIPSEMKNYTINKNGYLKHNIPFNLIFIIDLIITTIIISVLIKKNKMVKKNLNTSDYISSKDLIFRKSSDNIINSYTTHHTISSDYGSSGGGGFSSHSGSSGGGHSSGGGRHG